MKLKLGNSIALSMVAMLFLSMMAVISPVYAQPTIYMTDKDGNKYPPNVFPPAPGPYVGFKWNITVWVTGYTNVFTWQVLIKYDPAAGINCTRAWVADFRADYIFVNKPGLKFPVTTTQMINETTGQLIPGVAMAGDTLTTQTPASSPPDPDPAAVVIFEFEILKAPGKYETLSSVLNIDNVRTWLKNLDLSEISRTAVDGSYTWVWTPPPPARLGVKIEAATGDVYTVKIGSVQNPAKVTYLKSGTAPSNNVTVGVYLKEYNELWEVTSVTFCLCYNSTLLEILEPSIVDARWTTSSVTITEPPDQLDQLNVTVNDPVPSAPSGDVLLVTVKFHVRYQGEYPAIDTSPLEISTYEAYDHVGPIPLNPPHEGEVVIEGVRVRYLEVKPNRYITDKLETFNVEVWLNNVTESDRIIGAQFRLNYSATLLEVQKVTEGSFFKQFGNTFFVNYIVLSESDDPINYGRYGPHIYVGIVMLASDGQYTNFPKGSGILATVTFRGIYRSFDKALKSQLELSDIILVDDAQPVPNVIATTSPKNGCYEIFPLLPMLKVQPQVYEAKKKDESFNINVTIANLDSDTQLNSVEFELTYNATVLEVLNITEGPFLRGFGNTTFNYSIGSDSVTIQNQLKTLFAGFPNGNGTIATITFKAILRGFYPEETNSTLNLTEIVLLDVYQNRIPTSAPMNGFYKIFSLRPPVARFTYSPSMPLVTQEVVVFNASDSYDYYPGVVVSYFWDFGDGTNGTGVTVTHTYVDNGVYTVTLTVTDDDGLTDIDSQSITVLNRPPVASFTASATTVYTGEVIYFNASESYDPDGSIVSYVWDFGDGNTTTVTSSVITHSYIAPGTYNVTLTVFDDDGLSNSDAETVIVEAQPVGILLYAVIIMVLAAIVVVAVIITYYKRIRKYKSRTV